MIILVCSKQKNWVVTLWFSYFWIWKLVHDPISGQNLKKMDFCKKRPPGCSKYFFFMIKWILITYTECIKPKKLKLRPYSGIFDTKNGYSTRFWPKTSKLSYNRIRSALTCIFWSELSKKWVWRKSETQKRLFLTKNGFFSSKNGQNLDFKPLNKV